MPIVIIFIAFLFSSLISLQMLTLSQEQIFEKRLFSAGASYFASSSGIDLANAKLRAEKSLEKVTAFQKKDLPRWEDVFKESVQSSLEFNQGIPLENSKTFKKTSSNLSFDRYELSSVEVSLMDVLPEDAIDNFRLDYCLKGSSCPELIVDWFELDQGFSFPALKDIPEKSPISSSPCVSISGIKRCAVRSSIVLNAVRVNQASSDSLYQSLLRLDTPFAGKKGFLIRLWTVNKAVISFELSGEKGGKRVPLPHHFFEIDSQSSVRRLRQKMPVTPGLQDGLGYVLNVDEMGEK